MRAKRARENIFNYILAQKFLEHLCLGLHFGVNEKCRNILDLWEFSMLNHLLFVGAEASFDEKQEKFSKINNFPAKL